MKFNTYIRVNGDGRIASVTRKFGDPPRGEQVLIEDDDEIRRLRQPKRCYYDGAVQEKMEATLTTDKDTIVADGQDTATVLLVPNRNLGEVQVVVTDGARTLYETISDADPILVTTDMPNPIQITVDHPKLWVDPLVIFTELP